ncbi:MAG: DMT family transporter [Sphingobacteriia bacterium]|jgi:drug/metabolite transporter (DMT)-like permease|nr:MAG: DMT family transporter [Sphingobacteriia bacterium]TAH08539.1 MAG: DMT family transporter [Sphingobacteriia bacterium]
MKKAFIQLHTAVFLAGFTGILGVLISLDAMPLVWYRIMITVFSLSLLTWAFKKPILLPKKSVLKLFFIGTLIALHWVAFYASVKLSNVSIALVCFSSVGLFTALLEPIFVTRKINWAELLLGGLSLAGICLIFQFDQRYRLGIIVGLISAFLAALFSVLNKRNMDIAEPSVMILYELTGGLVLLTVLMPIYIFLYPLTVVIPTLSDWGWLFILSWLCTIIGMQLMLASLKKVSAFTQNLSLNLEPVYAIAMAFIFFDESKAVQPSFYYGVSLILLSVVLQMFRLIRLKRS